MQERLDTLIEDTYSSQNPWRLHLGRRFANPQSSNTSVNPSLLLLVPGLINMLPG